MAKALEGVLGVRNVVAGVVNCNQARDEMTRIKVNETGHPVPDQRGVLGVEEILALKDKHSIDEKDLVLCLISGGGSALMPCPVDGVSLEDKRKITELLLACGAEIGEINAVRKHLSRIKGGRLGRFYSPARVVSLIISDVVGDDPNVIASGPTVPDPSTFEDAYGALDKYGLLEKAPGSVVQYLQRGCEGRGEETPETLSNCENHIIGNNRVALQAMADKANERGFAPLIITAQQKGITDEIARTRAGEIIEGTYRDYSALLIGGETTPKLPGNPGRGGRNQHYVAVSVLELKDFPGEWIVASVGTDGSDYLPDVAGAIADNGTLAAAKAKGLNVPGFLESYDSNTLFREIGNSLIVTGGTGTNVSDVVLYLFR
jgi:glycerate-2-kinase